MPSLWLASFRTSSPDYDLDSILRARRGATSSLNKTPGPRRAARGQGRGTLEMGNPAQVGATKMPFAQVGATKMPFAQAQVGATKMPFAQAQVGATKMPATARAQVS